MKDITITADDVRKLEVYQTFLETVYIKHRQDMNPAALAAHQSLSTTFRMLIVIYDNARDMKHPVIDMGNDLAPNIAIQITRGALTSCKTFLFNMTPELRNQIDGTMASMYKVLEGCLKVLGKMLDNHVKNQPFILGDEGGRIVYDLAILIGVIAFCGFFGTIAAIWFENTTADLDYKIVLTVLSGFALIIMGAATWFQGKGK